MEVLSQKYTSEIFLAKIVFCSPYSAGFFFFCIFSESHAAKQIFAGILKTHGEKRGAGRIRWEKLCE